MSPSTETRECREFATELKFLVSRETADAIRRWARARLMPDPHAAGEQGDGYRITSLYFDTDAFDVFHRRGSFGRSKYRIRRYGDSGVAFLERKLKTGGLLAKRRSTAPLEDLGRLAPETAASGWSGFWFHRRLVARRLRCVCRIGYQRTARVAPSAYGPIRLTVDEDLRATPAAGMSFGDGAPETVLLPDQRIVELKFRRALPALFKSLVEEFALEPRRFSKYRLAAATLGLVPVPPGPAAGAPGNGNPAEPPSPLSSQLNHQTNVRNRILPCTT